MRSQSIRMLLVIGLLAGVLPLSFESASAHSFGSQAFERTWARTDLPVATGQTNRTWMWGPSGHTAAFEEPYHDAPGGVRLVQYTDKSRMEDNSFRASAPWDVTNGRLAYELMSGQMQISDANYQQRQSANIQIAGDSHPDSPTYSTFNTVMNHDSLPSGWTITQTIDTQGEVGSNAGLGQYGVTAQHYVPETDHTVASVFWTFMNSSGTIYENGIFQHANLFENPFFATGYPLTEAYWMHVPVGGQWQDVLGQCFERRCLTYTPGNDAGWQVEAGNIGQHYYQWRYGDLPPTSPPPGGDEELIEYLDDILLVLEFTDLSFEVFIWLMENPTFTDAWYDEFDEVMELWQLFYPFLNSLQPPPGFEAFHDRLLDAYWVLGLAADDFTLAFYLFDEYWFDQGFQKLEHFFELLDEAVDLLPGQSQPIYLEDGARTFQLERRAEILDHETWESLLKLE